MMKTARVLGAIVFVLSVSGRVGFADVVPAESRIAQVTVYPGAALVTRAATVKIPAGAHQIVLSDIVPVFDENSLRVSGQAAKTVRVLGAQMKTEFAREEGDDRLKALRKELQALEDEKRGYDESGQILASQIEFLRSIRLFAQKQYPEDLVTKVPSVQEMQATAGFLTSVEQENAGKRLDLEKKKRDVDERIQVVQRKIAELSRSNTSTRNIVVDVEAAAATEMDLRVSYLVNGATWRPVYDARADFNKSEVELVTYGVVNQRTGEDWTDAEVVLSTSKPSLGGRMPYVAPWFLRVLQPVPQGAKVLGYEEIGEQFAPRTSSYTAVADSLNFEAMGDGKPQEAEMAFAQAAEKGTGVVYKIPRPATIVSDGTDYKLPVSSQTMKADFRYRTYPRVLDYAYLRTDVVNAQEMSLPAGTVNIFLDGDFVGRSTIENVGPGEKFDLSLGVDENVKVTREQTQKKLDDVLFANISSPTVRVTYTYRIKVENYKTKDIAIEVFESMPVSQDEKIKVKIDSVKPEPTQKDWENRKGVWRWEMTLKPKDKKEIVYTFNVEYPRNVSIEGWRNMTIEGL